MGLSMPLSPPFRPCKLCPMIPLVSSSWNPSRSRVLLRKKSFMRATEDKVDISWAYLDDCSDQDGFCGWSVRRFDAEKQNGFQSLVKAGIGASVAAILLAAVAYCCRTNVVGFKFKENAPFNIFHDLWLFSGNSKGTMSSISEIPVERTHSKCSVPKQQNKTPASGGNKRIIIPVADLTQLDALHALKRLKVIEYDTNANELCTRREFARWLIKINSKLERKAKHKIVPMVMSADSLVAAFDDMDMNDSDFLFVQALGEAGIVPSRLSSSNLSHSNDERFLFTPDNFISRLDMLNWKAMVEYSIPSEMKEEISRTNPCLLDLNANSPMASPQLLMDLMHDDGSIVRSTFGNIRRLQADKPVTKAQAAVALTSGRMADVIRSEIPRLEAEEQSRFVEMEAIRSELVRSGAIHKHWEDKLCEMRKLALQVDRDLESALFDLEVERAAEDERLADYVKEKSALECQQELLLCLTKEVDEMCKKLVSETENFKTEKQNLESDAQDLVEKRGAILKARSVLESEKVAIHILRSWMEEESWRIQSRAKVLEQAILRWKVVGTALSNQLREQVVNQ